MTSDDDFEIRYQFRFPDDSTRDFLFTLDKDSLALKSTVDTNNLPEWTRLDYHKCSNCTLKAEDNPLCPVAKEYYYILDSFKASFSFEEVKVIAKVPERVYFKETSLQSGISSMIGIVNVTSGCPVLSTLRPMVRYHLPFASSEETTFRSASVFLLKKYLQSKDKGVLPKIDWQELADELEQVSTVNLGLAGRIKGMSSGDANINSLLILDGFAKITGFTLEDGVEELRYLFEDHLNPSKEP
jgi:hypothetical protein